MNWLYIDAMNKLQEFCHKRNRPMPFGDAEVVGEGHRKEVFKKILADAIQDQLDSIDGQIGLRCTTKSFFLYPEPKSLTFGYRNWFLGG